MKQKVGENPDMAKELAREISKLDSDILSVEIIDEPGHLTGSWIRDGYSRIRSNAEEVWHTAPFQQALFFSGKREASNEEVLVVEENEYKLLLRSPEQGAIVLVVLGNFRRSIEEILKLVQNIRNTIDSISNR